VGFDEKRPFAARGRDWRWRSEATPHSKGDNGSGNGRGGGGGRLWRVWHGAFPLASALGTKGSVYRKKYKGGRRTRLQCRNLDGGVSVPKGPEGEVGAFCGQSREVKENSGSSSLNLLREGGGGRSINHKMNERSSRRSESTDQGGGGGFSLEKFSGRVSSSLKKRQSESGWGERRDHYR